MLLVVEEVGQTEDGKGGSEALEHRGRDLRHRHAADLEQLEQISGRYPTRERFLTELTLDPPSAAGDQAGDPLLDEDEII